MQAHKDWRRRERRTGQERPKVNETAIRSRRRQLLDNARRRAQGSSDRCHESGHGRPADMRRRPPYARGQVDFGLRAALSSPQAVEGHDPRRCHTALQPLLALARHPPEARAVRPTKGGIPLADALGSSPKPRRPPPSAMEQQTELPPRPNKGRCVGGRSGLLLVVLGLVVAALRSRGRLGALALDAAGTGTTVRRGEREVDVLCVVSNTWWWRWWWWRSTMWWRRVERDEVRWSGRRVEGGWVGEAERRGQEVNTLRCAATTDHDGEVCAPSASQGGRRTTGR